MRAMLSAIRAGVCVWIPMVVSAQNVPVNELGLLPGDGAVLPATNSQQELAVARGASQHLVAWTDFRARSAGSQAIQSDGDIFGVRLDATGNPVDAAPFLIAGGMGLQQRPQIAWNGENWLVIYTSQDPVGGYFEDQLRAVRVSPAGQVLDAPPILFPPTQFTPNTVGLQVAGQGGQWLITRCIYHNDGYGTYLAGQRIAGSGQLLDVTPILLMDWVYGGTRLLAANGEYLAAGPDWYTSSNIKARRVGLNAQPIGPEFAVPGLDLAGDGSEYYVIWISNYTNLVGSRMSSTGALANPAGTPLFSDPGIAYYNATLTHDGFNWWFGWGAAATWRTLRIDPAGNVLDPGGVPLPIVIGGTVNYAYDFRLAPRAGGGVSAFWYDLRTALGNDSNVFALPISPQNEPQTERCLSTGTTSQRNPKLAQGPNGVMALAFVSEAANDDRVLVHFLSRAGRPLRNEPIEVYRGPNVGRVGIAFNGELYLLAFDVGASGSTTTMIQAIRMSPDGALLDDAPFDVMPGFNADVGALQDRFCVAGARVHTYPQFIYLWANRVDGATGQVLDGPSGLFLGGGYVNGAPRVRTDGTQWFVAAHSMWTHDSSQGDAILARVPLNGPPTQAINPTPISGGSGDLDLAFSGSKYLLVWRMNSLSNANNYIAGRIMNADGTFPPGYFTIAEAPGRQLRPTVTWDGDAFVVAWEDQRNQQSFFDARTDIYGIRVSETGALLDPAAFPICTGPEGDAGPAILARGGGVSFVASNHFMVAPPFDSYRVGVTAIGALAIPGDLNCDGVVNNFDIDPFVLALTDAAAYADAFPECDATNADVNGDGLVNNFDVDAFVALLGGA
ncbi:MAG: dockerin type I repeat-containing protein [Phycisphaerae bacterium]